MNHQKTVAITLLSLCLSCAPALAQLVFEAEVIRVVDGDTVVLRVGEVRYRARLHGIDAPESDQPWGHEATETLRRLLTGADGGSTTVTVQLPDIDRYGRMIVRLYKDNRYINEEMVVRGAAWRYVEYDSDGEFQAAEVSARRNDRGLWALSAGRSSTEAPIPPWEWRRR